MTKHFGFLHPNNLKSEGYYKNAYIWFPFVLFDRFVDIEEIIDHSLKFLFIITSHLRSLNICKQIIEHTH